jgi:hypothetical protein
MICKQNSEVVFPALLRSYKIQLISARDVHSPRFALRHELNKVNHARPGEMAAFSHLTIRAALGAMHWVIMVESSTP